MFRSLLVALFFLIVHCIYAQNEDPKASLNLYLQPWSLGVHAGVYKDKIYKSPYRNPLTYLEFQLPFYWALVPDGNDYDHPDRQFPVLKIVPNIVSSILSTGSSTLGISSSFSLKLFERLYFNYNLGLIWVMSQTVDGKGDGLKHGGNFHHFFSMEYPLTNRVFLRGGWTHISNGKMLGDKLNSSSSDALILGIRYSVR